MDGSSLDRGAFVGHTAKAGDTVRVQPLQDHLEGVAALAKSFGSDLDAGDWAELAGLWHDLGKYSERFQRYITASSEPDSHVAEAKGSIDHATAGAQHAVRQLEILGHLLAYPIAGHHSGLLDAIDDGACLAARLAKQVEPWGAAPDAIVDRSAPRLPEHVRDALARKDAFGVAFFVRMLFSCLVDADFLDTEAFMDSRKASSRPAWPADVR